MPLPKYIFNKEAEDVINRIIAAEDIYIGDHEKDPDMFYFNQELGRGAVTFFINQETGKVKVKYSDPENREKNDWYKSGVADNIKHHLNKHIEKSNTGGGRKKQKTRKNRLPKV